MMAMTRRICSTPPRVYPLINPSNHKIKSMTKIVHSIIYLLYGAVDYHRVRLLFLHGLAATNQFAITGFPDFHDIATYFTLVNFLNLSHDSPPRLNDYTSACDYYFIIPKPLLKKIALSSSLLLN